MCLRWGDGAQSAQAAWLGRNAGKSRPGHGEVEHPAGQWPDTAKHGRRRPDEGGQAWPRSSRAAVEPVVILIGRLSAISGLAALEMINVVVGARIIRLGELIGPVHGLAVAAAYAAKTTVTMIAPNPSRAW